MSTFTNTPNAISFSDIQGPQGPIGYTGAAGATGAAGSQGVQGISGGDGIVRTDIAFSGGISGSVGQNFRTIDEGKIRLVGSCVFGEQAEITSIGSTEIKVLVNAATQTGEPTEIGLVLNCNIPDVSNGETRLATAVTTVSGSGATADNTIVTLTLTPNTLINLVDTLSLWAYIKPTQAEMDNTLNYLTNLISPDTGDSIYTADQILKYKEKTYIEPYEYTSDALWLALRNDYNTLNDSIPAAQQLSILQAAQEDDEIILPVYNDMPEGKLKVYYLQLQ